MDVNFDQVVQVVRDFITPRLPAPRSIDANTALLRDGYIDSFGLVELIAELQNKLHIEIPDGSLIPEDFETPTVLYERLEQI